jgi:SAM-dependent methyltransferase
MGISETPGKVGPHSSQGQDPGEKECQELAGTHAIGECEEAGTLRARLVACLARDGIEHQRLSRVTVGLLKGDPALRSPMNAALAGGTQGLARALREGPGTAALQEPLILLALTRMILPDLELEGFLTVLRRLALEASVAPGAGSHADGGPAPVIPLLPTEFLVALARQCFFTGYVYAISGEEHRLLGDLEARPAAEAEPPPAAVATLAAYRPLSEWPGSAALVRQAEPPGASPLADLIRQQILEPREEAAHRAEILSRGAIKGRVSGAVRAHYEENPYPRWISVDRREPRSVAAVLRELFPSVEMEGLDWMTRPRILVAGCGTGQHLLQIHYRFRGARIHGLDLSLASLAYARRKIQEYGAEGITLEQADILSLGGWEERFDIVESVGVLQHLEDPVEGWRILRDLLVPGGLMKVGVYSARARAHARIDEARAYLEKRGFGSSDEAVRQARHELADRFRGDPDAGFLTARDFFSMQECRDLLFHAHEHLFTLPGIKDILKDLGLAFLGFEHPDPETRAAFLREHPESGAERNLDAWHDFETRNPGTFRDLYRLWARAV